MQPSEALGVAAQVAVTLAGFAGIVVVFRPQSVHEWSALDRVRLQLLLMNSAVPLAYSLAAMLFLAIDPPVAGVWRWCSALAFIVHIFLVVSSGRVRHAVATSEMAGPSKLMFYGIGTAATAATALQAINFAVWNRFWPFFTIIFVHLIAALVQFVRMLLLAPHNKS